MITKNLEDARKTSPKLGIATGSGKYLFSEWQRKYPDLSSGDYVLPCSDAKFICISLNSKKATDSAKNLLDKTENEILRVINHIVENDGNSRRRKDNPVYLESLIQLQKECLFAISRFGANSRVRYLEEGRKKIHDRHSGFWQDNSKRNKS